MKLKDISRTATFAWDNSSSSSPLLATGAVAGALDESFSNDSQLEIWAPDFSDTQGMRLGGEGKAAEGSITVGSRFNRLAWSSPLGDHQRGVLAAGMETGEINVYDPEKILAGSSADDARIFKNDKHTGPVRGLDFNPIQKNLLLSGGINAELFIFDLNNPKNAPIPPGPLSTKLNEITSLQWNPTVSRVFAASSSSGYTSVWDLKAGKEIVSLQYGGGAAKGQDVGGGVLGTQMGKRRGMSDVCWHPEQATRLITASEDDESPIIMLWDLRNTRAPERILSGHNKGVLSVSWCKQDADLLLSCGKDNRTLCWNPQTGEIVGELPSSNDWSFQTTWCPRNPDLLATASFDGHIGIHSLQTTHTTEPPAQKFEDDVPADDVFGALGDAEPVDDTANLLSLKQPPKWLRRPVSATFGFGGLLASTSNLPGANGKHQSGVVHLRSIVSEQGIIDRATALDKTAGDKDKLEEFCNAKTGESDAAWKTLQTLFKADSRDELVALLGFSKEDVVRQVEEAIKKLPSSKAEPVKATAESVASTDNVDEKGDGEKGDELDTPTSEKPADPISSAVSNTSEGTKDTEATTPTENNLFDDDGPGTPAATGADFFSTMAAGGLRNAHLDSIIPHKNDAASTVAATVGSRASSVRSEVISKENVFNIYPSGEGDVDRLITQALVLGDFPSAVELCLASERFADALLLAVRGGPELLQSTQKAYFAKRTTTTPFLRVFQSIVTEDLTDIVQNADLGEWRVIFVVLCTFAKSSEFNSLADQLGQRLHFKWKTLSGSDSPEAKTSAKAARNDATLCYLAARRLEKVVSIWSDEMREEEESTEKQTRYTAHAQALQSFIEKVAVFTAATGYVDEDLLSPTESTEAASQGARTYKLASLYDRFYEYADLLATQGLIELAAKYVQKTPSDYKGTGAAGSELDKARDRLFRAAGITGTAQKSTGGITKVKPSAPAPQPSYAGNAGYAPAPTGSSGYAPQPTPYAPTQPATSSYYPPPQQQQQTPYQPSAQPAISGPYNPPQQSAPSGPYNPPQQSGQYNPPSQNQYGYNTSDSYAPSQSTQQYGQPSQYGTSNGYNADPQAQGYGAPQAYGVPPQSGPPAGPPRAGGANGSSNNATPPPIPATQRRDMPGWNDAPSFAPPKRPQSAVKDLSKPAPIMSPFPMSTNPMDSHAQGGFAPPSNQLGQTPPPSRAGQPGMLPPPPKGGPRPPSAQAVARAAIPPQGPPPAQNPAPQRQQSAIGQVGGPPPQQRGGPPPGQPSRQQLRGGPPPPGVLAGPPPPRVLSPLNPGSQARGTPPISQSLSQGQQRVGGPPPQRVLSPPGQAPPPGARLGGPPPPGRAGPPPPSQTQAQPAAQAQPVVPAKATYPAGDRSHIPTSSKPIYETLYNELNRVKQANLPAHLTKIVDDTERRLNILFDGLNNETVPKTALDQLNKISRAIAAKDANGALALHVELLTNASGDMNAWAPGVKQLIRLGL